MPVLGRDGDARLAAGLHGRECRRVGAVGHPHAQEADRAADLRRCRDVGGDVVRAERRRSDRHRCVRRLGRRDESIHQSPGANPDEAFDTGGDGLFYCFATQ